MTPGKKQAFEPTGLIPRSIVRTFDRFYKQLLPRTKYSAIREYRISRYQVLVSIRCLCTLLILPLVTRIIANWLIFPQVQYFLDVTYQDEHVFSEIDQFSQVIFFDSLLDNNPNNLSNRPFPQSPVSAKAGINFKANFACLWPTDSIVRTQDESSGLFINSVHNVKLEDCKAKKGYETKNFKPINQPYSILNYEIKTKQEKEQSFIPDTIAKSEKQNKIDNISLPFFVSQSGVSTQAMNTTKQDQALQEKIFELADFSHSHALQSITNVFADFCSISVLIFLLITLKPEITILKSFLIEVIYNLSDTTKSFLLILMTDLLVGFHSPRGWETMFSLILYHFGLPENQDFVFLFVATLPVILDTVFKYWIFRHLNKISPSTVATYHNMIE